MVNNRVVCDLCGMWIEITPRNIDRIHGWIRCDCHEQGISPPTNHVISIPYGGRWFRSGHFLTKKGPGGVICAAGHRDKVTAEILLEMANLEGGFFRPTFNFGATEVRILWVGGDAIGFYGNTKGKSMKTPKCFTHLFVRREFRSRGHGSKLVQDFLHNSRGPYLVESPNEDALQIFEREGECELMHGRIVSSRRMTVTSL